MAEITHRNIKTNGITLHIAEAGTGPLVLLLHGWPESWYSWRHQMTALADAGYHAVAPDVRGYGQSDKPHAIEAYSMKNMMADYLGLLDALGEQKAVIVGHDWGAGMAWTSAALHPDRFPAVVGMSVPHLGRAPMPPTQLLKTVFQNNWFYILYFQEPGLAEAEFEADLDQTFRKIFAGVGNFDAAAAQMLQKKKGDDFLTGISAPEKLPDWLTEDDIAFFVKEFKGSGFRGPLNRYRNMDRDWEELPELGDKKINQPALFITGENDPVRTFAPADGMATTVPNLKTLIIPGAGHWVQQERPTEVNESLLAFVKGL